MKNVRSEMPKELISASTLKSIVINRSPAINIKKDIKSRLKFNLLTLGKMPFNLDDTMKVEWYNFPTTANKTNTEKKQNT
jgi:hypothetical protein